MSSRQRDSLVSLIEGQKHSTNKRPFVVSSSTSSTSWKKNNMSSTNHRQMSSSTTSASGSRTSSSRNFSGSTGSEEIVSRLHESLAVFRRERDDLYRQRELASERHRLLVAERKDLERIAFIQTTKLQKLEAQLKEIGVALDGTCLEHSQIGKLRLEVEKLNKDVQFQHAELLHKREKADKLKTRYKEEEAKRTKKLFNAKEMARRVREQSQKQSDGAGVRNILKHQLLVEGDKPFDEQSFAESRRSSLMFMDGINQKLPRILDERMSTITKDKVKLQDDIDLARYKQNCLRELIQKSAVSSSDMVANVSAHVNNELA